MAKQTALEAAVQRHEKEIDEIKTSMSDGMKEMVESMQGLRSDMAERGEKMIGILNDQNTTIVKSQTDHEASDILRFAQIHTKIAYWVGGGMAASAMLSAGVALAALYISWHAHG
jgi:hypothetical protein